MKRFNNILVLYDFEMGADETLQRGVNLAIKNDANLIILNVIEDVSHSLDMLSERRKLMERICNGFPIEEEKFRIIIKQGDKAEEALSYINRFDIDLVITPTESGRGFEKLIGKDTTAELLKGSNCPIWVVRPGSAPYYRTVLVAVNAGKENALDCKINNRLLNLGKSLADMEMAELKVLYVWDYDPQTKNQLSSEIPDDVRVGIYEGGRYQALAEVVKLITHVLGEPMSAKPVVRQGNVEDEIAAYIDEVSADILVSEGTPTSPLMDAVMGNRGLYILNNTKCCVLVSRP